jgi:hypothetical protein
MYIESFKQHFSAIDDHRQSAKVTYPLFDILFAVRCYCEFQWLVRDPRIHSWSPVLVQKTKNVHRWDPY